MFLLARKAYWAAYRDSMDDSERAVKHKDAVYVGSLLALELVRIQGWMGYF